MHHFPLWAADDRVRHFLKYLGLFFLLFLSIASICLRGLMILESNPFFYANF